jgi:hypothetical protein
VTVSGTGLSGTGIVRMNTGYTDGVCSQASLTQYLYSFTPPTSDTSLDVQIPADAYGQMTFYVVTSTGNGGPVPGGFAVRPTIANLLPYGGGTTLRVGQYLEVKGAFTGDLRPTWTIGGQTVSCPGGPSVCHNCDIILLIPSLPTGPSTVTVTFAGATATYPITISP